jgi:hypothetical protein
MCSEQAGRSSRPGSPGQPRPINRRSFLKISGTGLAGAVMLGSLGAGTVLAQDRSTSPGSSLMEEFRKAGEEYGIPRDLLMAMGYVNTRWEMPPPRSNEYEHGDLHGWGSYGIMALVQNPFSDTLGEASRLTGIPEEKLKTDRAANIRGAAALLASAAGENRPEEPQVFRGAVAGRGHARGHNYVAVAGVGGGELYAEEVFEVLDKGASRTTPSGEKISLPARKASVPDIEEP